MTKLQSIISFSLLTLLICCVALVFSGCTASESIDGEQAANTQLITEESNKEIFSVALPNWERVSSDDKFNEITVRKNSCAFALNKVPAPQSAYLLSVREYMQDNLGATILQENPLYLTLQNEGYTMHSKIRMLFCADHTYALFYSCAEQEFDEIYAERIFSSLHCEKEWDARTRSRKMLGLAMSPQDPDDLTTFYEGFNLLRDHNVDINHLPLSWEKDTEIADLVLPMSRNKGLRTSLALESIHTSVKGPLQVPFKSWDDDKLINGYADYAIELLEKHADHIDYLSVGNEVDIYFKMHPQELNDYVKFYGAVYEKIKKKYPNLQVGMNFAYHEMRANNNFDAYNKLKDIGDFNSFTFYTYDEGFLFTKDPQDIYDALKEIEELVEGKPFALQEVGWNTATSLKGTEEDQLEAVHAFFDYVEQAPDNLAFAVWFLLHDGTPTQCLNAAKSFLEDDDPIIEDPTFMRPFSTFLCHLGLRDNEGNPKKAWDVFVQRAEAYK